MGEAINAIREESYVKLNEAGKIKPLHDFKGQMEKMGSMIAQEESSVSEKLKAELLQNATLEVHKQFASSKQLKKTALESAIAAIKGDKKSYRSCSRCIRGIFSKDCQGYHSRRCEERREG